MKVWLAAALMLVSVGARADDPPNRLVAPWATKLFADAIAVDTPGRMIFVSGLGSEDETTGKILYLGDFAAQCDYAYGKLAKALQAMGAGMQDVVKIVSYTTDVRNLGAMNACRQKAFAGVPLPTHTFLVVSSLALPGMMVEIDATALKTEKK
jgi:enamine deaminase RidA (YjgF/YER057c/UK114 family)